MAASGRIEHMFAPPTARRQREHRPERELPRSSRHYLRRGGLSQVLLTQQKRGHLPALRRQPVRRSSSTRARLAAATLALRASIRSVTGAAGASSSGCATSTANPDLL
jgi:hypothetical protein